MFAATAAWIVVAAAASGGDPWPAAGVVAASGTAVGLACVVARFDRRIVPGAILAAAAVLASRPDIFSHRPSAGPFGYVNASSAFFVLASLAALMLAVAVRRGSRVGAVAVAVVFAVVPIATRSLAAAVMVVVAPVVALGAAYEWTTRRAVVVLAVASLAAIVATALLGWTAGRAPSSVEILADRTLSSRRLALWHDAVVLIHEHPLAGVGPGTFAEASPTARLDRDTRWAHSVFLQMGAETGVPGLALTVSIFGWAFVVLGRRRSPLAALAAAAVACVAILGGVDHVLNYPAVPITAAALVGSALGDHDIDEPTTGGNEDAER